MFEFNYDAKVDERMVENTKVFTIDNFYNDPDEVVQFLIDRKPNTLWKESESPSNNGIHIEERRHIIFTPEIIPVYMYITDLIHQEPFRNEPELVATNMTRFFKGETYEFNDYENCYWWPHIDLGYNAIIYLNKDDEVNGTNLYRRLSRDEYGTMPEHFKPWREKKNYELIETLRPKYNRLVLFDGLIEHGMHIEDDRYLSNEYRLNQVLQFFHSERFEELHKLNNE